MTRRTRIFIAVLLGVLALGAGTFWRIEVQSGHADALTLYGNVDIREVALAFRQPGRLVALHVDEGDPVKAGQLLAELDAVPYRDALAQAKARLQKAEAVHAKLVAGSRPQEIAAARQAVVEARAVLAQREAEWARQTQLINRDATSQQALEAARMAKDVALASLATAREKASLAEEGARKEDIAAAAAEVAAAAAELAIARTALADTRLVSPADGVVMSRVREPGSMVGAQAAALTLSLRHPVYVRAYVGETDLARVRQGAAVSLAIDGSGKTYHGKIGFISPRAEFTPKSVETPDLRTDLVYRIRITVLDDDESLKQGMPVTIVLEASAP